MEFNTKELVDAYQSTDEKPDKKYSILPTVLGMIGDLQGKVVLDLGCGSGFFTEALAERGARMVIGIDNSVEQLAYASKNGRTGLEYRYGDIFQMEFPECDVIVAPFVLNYAKNVDELARVIQSMSRALTEAGKLIVVIDLPNQLNYTKFGAKKSLTCREDGGLITIDLFREESFVCKLHSTYYLPETVEKVLNASGFKTVTWQTAIVHPDGIRKYGRKFWAGYTDDPELGYLVASKR